MADTPLAEDFGEEDILLTQMREAGLVFEDSLTDLHLPKDLLGLVTAAQASKYHVIPVRLEKDAAGRETLVLVTDRSETLSNMSRVQQEFPVVIRLLLSGQTNVRQAMADYYNISNYAQTRVVSDQGGGTAGTAMSPLQKSADDILQYGASVDGSDIHIKPFHGGTYVWIRINGELKDFTDYFHIRREDADQLINIFKGRDTSGSADASNKLMPNSGSFGFTRAGTSIRSRLLTVPVGGSINTMTQKLDIRLQAQTRKRADLSKLYYGPDLKTIQTALYKSSSGMFINAGPVGTGKTTALYAEIDYLWNLAQQDNNVLHVFCIENPIEIEDERYTQVQVRETRDETTALSALDILDAALRADPNVILFGEVRNTTEAEAAMRASQTGLKLFTTIHAANCIKTVTRLLNLGVNPLALLAEMKFVLCQRLIPVLCPDCSQPHVLTEKEKSILSPKELAYLTESGANLRERGNAEAQEKCQNPNCHNGILHRMAVPEYIVFNDDIRDALISQNDFHSVRDMLKQNDFQSMWDKGLKLVHNGKASLSDVISRIGKD